MAIFYARIETFAIAKALKMLKVKKF